MSPVTRVFYNPPICSDFINEPDALDLTLRDGNHASCLAIPDPSPSSIIVRLTRQGADLPRTTIVRVSVQDINCSPGEGLMVVTAAFCKMEPCGPRSLCTFLYSMPGEPCMLRCCDRGQPCGTFYIILQRHAIVGTVCEINLYVWHDNFEVRFVFVNRNYTRH